MRTVTKELIQAETDCNIRELRAWVHAEVTSWVAVNKDENNHREKIIEELAAWNGILSALRKAGYYGITIKQIEKEIAESERRAEVWQQDNHHTVMSLASYKALELFLETVE